MQGEGAGAEGSHSYQPDPDGYETVPQSSANHMDGLGDGGPCPSLRTLFGRSNLGIVGFQRASNPEKQPLLIELERSCFRVSALFRF